MTDQKAGLTRTVTVVNELGIHARSAAKIAELAGRARSFVWIAKNGERADATSILDILGLACFKGTMITLIVDDPADAGILQQIVALVESGFGE